MGQPLENASASAVAKLIENKRDGRELSQAEFRFLIEGYLRGGPSQGQMAALLMAIYFQGLVDDETEALTRVLADSGSRLEFPADKRPLVDRHSTGGVGDKCAMILPPILAALGFRVPSLTIQGAGFAGGTLDKIRGIPGICVELSRRQIVDIVQEVGCAISGPTDQLAPADRALFQLRAETATVASPGLIASSILAKKLAASLSFLVVDVKFGSGSLVGSRGQATKLASLLNDVAARNQLRCGCLITRMETPVGRTVGRWLEVQEATHFLSGVREPDLMEIAGRTAGLILLMAGREKSMRRALHTVEQTLRSGKPLEYWRRMLAAQGADLKQFDQLMSGQAQAAWVVNIASPTKGCVLHCAARDLGELAARLAAEAGVRSPAQSYFVGLDRLLKPGDEVAVGQPLARIHAPTRELAEEARQVVCAAYTFSSQPGRMLPRVCAIFESGRNREAKPRPLRAMTEAG